MVTRGSIFSTNVVFDYVDSYFDKLETIVFCDCEQYLTNKAATMMDTTSRIITLQTPEPKAFPVFYEYRIVGKKGRASIMIRLTDGWNEVAEQLNFERGNTVRLKICDKLDDCFHIIQIPIINIAIHETSD